jgi:shikimate kinase
MGSGKSAVARRLAELRDAPWCDLDRRIERMFGISIAAWFLRGEPEFRRVERLALRSLVDEPGFAARPAIVATGGGTVIDPANREAMRIGTVVFLEVPLPELARRLRGAPAGTRPLLAERAPEDVLAAQWAARRAAYREHATAVDGTGDPDAVARRILPLVEASG